jgi:TRAP-type uncharacterized transport system fused permease subunit
MNEQEIKELFSDEAYVSSLLALDTAEEVQASLAEKGLDLSEAEITSLLDTLQKYAESGGELSEADLETVTGGTFTFVLLILTIVTGILGIGLPEATKRRW